MFWQSVEKNPSNERYEAYLKQWPNGSFASLARMQLQTKKDSLVKQNTTSQTNEMTAAEINNAFSGKTVSATHHIKKIDSERYYGHDGKLSIVVTSLGFNKQVEGRWAAKSGKLCHQVKNNPMKCRKVEKHGDVVTLYTPTGDLCMTIKGFRSGNQL